MLKIYSKINPNKLLHIIAGVDDIADKYTEVTSPEQFIQVLGIQGNEGDKFRPHKHLTKKADYWMKVQECWIIMQGSIEVRLYDVDNSFLCNYIMKAGEFCVTLDGGHTFDCLCDATKVLEVKTGPYEGQSKDKEFIE